MSFVTEARKKQAESIISALKKRNMNGYYCDTREEALALVLSMMPEGSTIAWGGSASINECNIPQTLLSMDKYTVYDRAKYTSPEDAKLFKSLTVNCDYFFMSSNAITLDGELINVDGYGNRVASLIYGPEHVIIVAGMNKIVSDVEEGYKRTRNVASPPNTIRLGKNTPCAALGKCGNCFSEDCICNQIVVTRRSRDKDRIHVILVGENLGF